MSIDKRSQERYSRNIRARITYRHQTEEVPVIDTVTANISSGGAFLETAHPFPLAAKIKVEFLLDFDDLKRLKFILSLESLRSLSGKTVWVCATAVVIRREAGGVGIIFDTDYQLTPMCPPHPEDKPSIVEP
ncbi:MAG: PilZ domain-containing protein [Desulforhopalus sp.]|nr:PilZ domain-containing protein [Desulforhopalus sp.]